MIITLTFISLLTILMMLIFSYIRRRTTRSAEIPPGPYPWPVIGNFHQMGKNPHIKLASMARTHGPIMSIRLGARLVVVGSSVEAATHILKTNDCVLSARHLSYTHPASSPNLNRYAVGFARECNEQWKYMRSICRAGLFSNKAIQFQAKIREKNVASMVNYLHAMEGQVVNVSQVILDVVLNTMSNILFSGDVFVFGPGVKGARFKELTRKYLNLLATPNLADLFPIMSGLDIQGLKKNVREINEKIFTMWQEILQERREQRSKGIQTQVDFLDSLLEIGFSDNHINHLLLVCILMYIYTFLALLTTLIIFLVFQLFLRINGLISELQGQLILIVHGVHVGVVSCRD